MKKSSQKIVIAAIIVVAACTAFLCGKNVEKANNKKVQELNVKLHRSDMLALGQIDEPIYVTGHKSPDSDTVTSSILYANFLRELGYDAHAVVLGEVTNEPAYILESAGVEVPPLLEDASGKTMVLVDHSEYTQSADGLKDAKIISIIDHHNDGAVTTSTQLVYDARPLGATATIIWIRYRDYGIKYNQQMAKLFAGGILSDTKNFQSTGTTEADRIAFSIVSKEAGIKDADAYYKEMYKAKISYGDMSDEQIFYSDYKEYEINKKKYSVGMVNVYDENDAKAMVKRMKSIMPKAAKDKGMDYAFSIIQIYHDDIAITYLAAADEKSDEILQKTFGDQGTYSDGAIVINLIVGRKRMFVPAVNALLEK